MQMSEVMDLNAKARERKKQFLLHHVEIHPERDLHGRQVKNGGYTVHTVKREKDQSDYGGRTAEKPFGAGEHEEMLAHVANELNVPEPGEEDSEGEGHTPAVD